jgi:hypothetical protein
MLSSNDLTLQSPVGWQRKLLKWAMTAALAVVMWSLIGGVTPGNALAATPCSCIFVAMDDGRLFASQSGITEEAFNAGRVDWVPIGPKQPGITTMAGNVFTRYSSDLYTVINHHLYKRPATRDYYEWTQVSDAYGINALAQSDGGWLWGVAFEANLYRRHVWESTWTHTTDAKGIKTMTAAHAGEKGDLLFAQSGNYLWYRNARDVTSLGWTHATDLRDDAYGIRALTTHPSQATTNSASQLLIGVTDGTTPGAPSRWWTRRAEIGNFGWTWRDSVPAPPDTAGHHVVALASSSYW